MELFGSNGSTGLLELPKKTERTFSRASMDEFIVDAADVGEPTKLQVGVKKGRGDDDHWHLDKGSFRTPVLLFFSLCTDHAVVQL